MSETALSRLSRLLAMVPWLLAHPGSSLTEAAAEFAVTQAQIVKDLELLFVCGLPGHLPDDLIEAEWDTGYIYLANAEAISRPLRLGVDETLALMVGLQALAQVPGVGERAAVNRALAKLIEAAGSAAETAGQVQVHVLPEPSPHVVATAQQALAQGRRLRLEYLVPHRDQPTLRDVDPLAVRQSEGYWYLHGWCHRAEAERIFRLDRVLAVTVLEIVGSVPPPPQRDLSAHVFAPGASDQLVELILEPAGRWVADYYRVEQVHELPDGQLQVFLRTGDLAWVRALALRLGDTGQVVRPAELVADIAQTARAALAGYADDHSGAEPLIAPNGSPATGQP
jgi:proteasome accessory factor C